MKKSLVVGLCAFPILLSGCAGVVAPPSNDAQTDAYEFVRELYRSIEIVPLAATLEKVGKNPKSFSYSDENTRQWWTIACVNDEAVAQDSVKRVADFCQYQGGVYSSTGTCWKGNDLLFYANITRGQYIDAKCPQRSLPVSIHVTTPNQDRALWFKWMQGLATTALNNNGSVRTYQGEPGSENLVWKGHMPLIVLDDQDNRKLIPRISDAKIAHDKAIYEQDMKRQAQRKAQIEDRTRRDNERNAKLIPVWKARGVGTKVCQLTQTRSGLVQSTGFVEGFSQYKLKIRISHMGGAGWTVGGFTEHTVWDYPENWSLCR